FTLPVQMIERPVTRIAEARTGQVQTLLVTICAYHSSAGKGPQRISVYDNTAEMQIVYFHAIRGFEQKHPVGSQRWISGKVENFGQTLQVTHPDYVVDQDARDQIPEFETVYPATAAVSTRLMRKFIQTALQNVPDLPEWLSPAPDSGFSAALRAAHNPTAPDDLLPQAPMRQRLAYDEALAHQLALKARKHSMKARPVLSLAAHICADKALAALPFCRTHAQFRALDDIRDDRRSGFRLNRPSQDDVGSSKTLVALLAMLDVA